MTESELIAQVVQDIRELSGALDRVGETIAESEGQTHARWQLLSAATTGDKTVSQLARRLGLVRQSVQRVADALVQERLVAYKKNPSHSRAPHVRLTPAGKRVLKRLEKRARRFRGLVSKNTTKRSLADLRETVAKLRDAVATAEGD